jgi:N-terminal acetyltransferase B complex catalytic subunit
MSVIRPFEATDVLRFTSVQADPWTATYHNGYYASYLAQWPDFCVAAAGAFDDNVGAYSEFPEPPEREDTAFGAHTQ